MMNQANKKTELIKAIEEYSVHASKGQKQIALYMLALNKEFEKSSISYISKEIGVSESTLKRFLTVLGYDKMQDFLEQLYTELALQMNSDWDYRTVALKEKESIDETLKILNEDALQQALELLTGASKVYILGIRSCYPIAMILSYYLKMIGIETVLMNTTDMNEIFEQMVHIKEKDLFFAISFADYSLRTLRALEYANEKKASIITLTDGKYSPMNMYSSCNLWAKIGQMSIVDSMTAPLSVIYSLVAQLANRLGEQVKDNMKQLEEVWENNDVYGDDTLIAQSMKGMGN